MQIDTCEFLAETSRISEDRMETKQEPEKDFVEEILQENRVTVPQDNQQT